MRAVRTWLLAITVAAVAILTIGFSETFQTCIQHHRRGDAQQADQEGVALSSGFTYVRDCIGLFFQLNSGIIVALFTIIVGVSTWLLWRATRDLVRGSEKTAERQLRGYVFIDHGAIEIVNETMIKATISFKNFGQTPGYDFEVGRTPQSSLPTTRYLT